MVKQEKETGVTATLLEPVDVSNRSYGGIHAVDRWLKCLRRRFWQLHIWGRQYVTIAVRDASDSIYTDPLTDVASSTGYLFLVSLSYDGGLS